MRCPECSQSVAVPKLGDLKELPTIGELENVSAEKNFSSATVEADSPFVVVALGLIATAALLVASYAALRWYLSPVDLTTESHLELYQEEYQKLPAALMIREYESIEKFGLELPIATPYIKQAEQRRQWGTAAVGSAIAAALSIIGVAFLSRRRHATTR